MSAFTHKLGQVTYPRMERQDLTQGQLGSFKFTPTDEVHRVFAGTSPRLAQQFTSTIPKDYQISKLPVESLPAVSNIGPSVFESSYSANSPTRLDSAFFDTYIKPDLANSRLRLGPNTLRAAVDGLPTSPRRNPTDFEAFQQALYADITQTNMAQNNENNMYSAASCNPIPALNPTASDFAVSDTNLLHTSLIRALAAEQQAHQLTKEALQSERNERYKAEAEAQKYLEHNRSLIGSVNMLKSVIQHSMKKEQAAVEKAEHMRFGHAVESTGQQQTLLHDAVKNLRAPVPKPKPKPQPLIDSAHLFNFDLVESQGSPALRKHFSIFDQETEQTKTTEDHKNASLAEKSTENLAKPEKSEEMWSSGEATTGTSLQEISQEDQPAALQSMSNNVPVSINRTNTKTMAMPFDAHVQWSVETIFADENDKFQRLREQSSLFSQHPVRFLPDKSDKNIYRTIMMDFIPRGATYRNVLDTIQGGAVESIQLVGPIGHSTAYMTARVVFNYELGAQNVYMRGQNPGIEILGQRVRVWQVLEATYPRDDELEKAIFDDGFTRFLLIENAVESSLNKIPTKLARQQKAGFIVEIGKAFDGLPLIEFTSVAESFKALKQLIDDPDFGGSRFDFEEDPCNDPY